MRGTRAKHLRRLAELHKADPPVRVREMYQWLKRVWKTRSPSKAYAALRRIK